MKSRDGQEPTIDAVIGAGIAADFAPFHLPGSTPCPGGRNAIPVDPRYVTLLYRLLAASSAGSTQCVQFVACGARAQATGVALAAARTAASLIGRSLVINARLGLDADAHPEAMGHVPVPDAFVPRLYHHRLAQRPGDIALLSGGARRSVLNTLVSPFRFVAIDCPPFSGAPTASALAPFCIGSVLVVRAGASTREAVKDAAKHVTSAGGKIIGTVLDDAPADLPRWVVG